MRNSASPLGGLWLIGRPYNSCWLILYVELKAARLLVYEAACKLYKGEDIRVDAYISKSNADEMAFRVADRCMQILGGIGLTKDMPVEKMWRQQRSFRITEGQLK